MANTVLHLTVVDSVQICTIANIVSMIFINYGTINWASLSLFSSTVSNDLLIFNLKLRLKGTNLFIY